MAAYIYKSRNFQRLVAYQVSASHACLQAHTLLFSKPTNLSPSIHPCNIRLATTAEQSLDDLPLALFLLIMQTSRNGNGSCNDNVKGKENDDDDTDDDDDDDDINQHGAGRNVESAVAAQWAAGSKVLVHVSLHPRFR